MSKAVVIIYMMKKPKRFPCGIKATEPFPETVEALSLTHDTEDPYGTYLFASGDPELLEKLISKHSGSYFLKESGAPTHRVEEAAVIDLDEVMESTKQALLNRHAKYKSWEGTYKRHYHGCIEDIERAQKKNEPLPYSIVEVREVNCTKALIKYQLLGQMHETWVPLAQLEEV